MAVAASLRTVAFIGAGNVACALASGLVGNGLQVRFGVPNPAKYASLSQQFSGRAVVTDVTSAISGCENGSECVVLAVPYDAALRVAESVPDWGNRVLIDATNPIGPGLAGLLIGTHDSGAETIARRARNARVVKAFNTTGFENLADPRYGSGKLLMPVAADDAGAKQLVMQMATVLGFDAIDAGPLSAARELEPFAMLWIRLAMQRGLGRHWGFTRALR